MMNYAFNSRINQYLEDEINKEIRAYTSAGLVRSETEFAELIKSKLGTIGGSEIATSFLKHQATAVVSSKAYAALLDSMRVDLLAMYREMDELNTVIKENLLHSKSFYRRMKNKVFAMNKELSLMKQHAYDVSASEYSFFENFDDTNPDSTMLSVTVDKKIGQLTLEPASFVIENEPGDVEKVEVTRYPVENKDGGVYDTSNPANDIELNYASGDKQMLKNGLWKIQILAAKVPKVAISMYGTMKTLFDGFVVDLDVYFTSAKTLNYISLDVFGEHPLKVAAARYKETDNGTWKSMLKDNEDGTTTMVTGESADVIVLSNFRPVNAKVIRLTIHQKSSSTVNELISSTTNMVSSILKDLRNRRYSHLSTEFTFDDQLPRPGDRSDEGSLMDRLLNTIETTQGIRQTEERIKQLLIPRPLEINFDLSDWNVFEVGAWSIDPGTVKYAPNAHGIYISHDPSDAASGYKISGIPSQMQLYVEQADPGATSAEWYLLNEDNSIEIPILPEGHVKRKETCRFLSYMPLVTAVSNGTKLRYGYNTSMLVLDYPVHPDEMYTLKLYENGKELKADTRFGRMTYDEFYNFKMVHFPELVIHRNARYVVEYTPARIDTVEYWVLRRTGGYSSAKYLEYYVAFADENTAKAFISAGSLGSLFSPARSLCHISEYYEWFKNGTRGCFIDYSLLASLRESSAYPGAIATYRRIIGWAAKCSPNSKATRTGWMFLHPVSPKSPSESGNNAWEGETPSISLAVSYAGSLKP